MNVQSCSAAGGLLGLGTSDRLFGGQYQMIADRKLAFFSAKLERTFATQDCGFSRPQMPKDVRSRSRSRERRRDRKRDDSRERSRRRSRSRRRWNREASEYRESSRERYESRRDQQRDKRTSDRWSAFDDDSQDRSDRWQPQPHRGDEEYGFEQQDRQQDRRRQAYARHLESGLDSRSESDYSRSPSWSEDSAYDHRSSDYRSRPRYSRREPTATLFVRGIPDNKDESDLHELFGSWPGIANIRVSRDRLTGKPRGFAFVEFESPEAAERVMEKERGYLDLDDGAELTLEFSHSQAPAAVQPSQALDWVCNRCQTINFARRSECHQCSTVKPADAQRVSHDADAPSHVLKVSNLDPNATEEALHYLISPHAPVKEVRIILDRQFGVPKGFAFAQFHSVADAAKVLHALQDCKLEGQERPLRFAFARDRQAAKPPVTAAAVNALEAAQQMSAYQAWAPTEFDESALQAVPEGARQSADAQEPAEASRASSAENDRGNGSTPDGEFQYDSTSGYYYHAASGYYYDANSGLYFDSSDQKWKRYDPETGQYVPVEEPESTESAAQAAIAATNAAVESMGHLQAPELEYKPPPEAKKRGAIIGSAAKLNPEGVLAAAREARAKEELQKRREAAATQRRGKAGGRRPPGPSVQASSGPQPQPGIAPMQQPQSGNVKGVIRSSGKWGGPRAQSTV